MKIRLIHVGVGGRGKWPVARVVQREDYESVALVDIRPEALAAARDVTGLPDSACFTTLKEALDKKQADAVVVITPPQLHAEQCLEAAQAGKHVLVEKPFTMRLEEARGIVAEADRHGRCVAVCQNAKYSAPTMTIHRLIRERTFGRPAFGLMTKHSWRPGTHHSGKVRHSYLWERGIHDFDTMRFLFDAQPVRVWGHSFNPSWSPYDHGAGAYAWVEFEGGATCGYLCTFGARKNDSTLRIDLEGGTLELVGKELRLRRPGAEADEVIPMDESPSAETVLLDGFYRYVTEGVEPEFGGRRNLTTMALVEGVGIASDESRVVEISSLLRP